MAVKLPSANDLGAMPSVRSGRPIATIDTSAIARGNAAKANAAANLGDKLSSTGNKLAAQKEAEDEFEAERRFQEFKWSEEQSLQESQRNAQPGRVDGFADDWASGYKERAGEFFKTIPDSVKAKYDSKLFGFEREGYRSAARFAHSEKKRFSINSLADHAKLVAKDGDLRSAYRSYDEVIARNPHLTPIEKDEIARKHKESIRTQHIDAALMRGDDPEQILRDHGYIPGGKMPKENAPSSPLKIDRDGEHSVIHAGSGAKFRVAAPYADRFAGFIADLEAEGIEVKGEQSGGYADRNIRGTNTPSKHSHGEAIDINWGENAEGKRGAIAERLGEDKIRALAAKHGLKWGGDFKSRSRDDMHFEVDRDAVVRRELPAPKGDVFNRGVPDEFGDDGSFNKGVPGDFREAGDIERAADDDDATGAVSFGPQKVAEGATLPRYGDMPLSHSDVHKLRTALSHKYQERLRSDIARIEEGQEEERDENGRTWFDKAKPILTQNVYNQWKTKRDAAILTRDATDNLHNMSDEEFAAHRARIGIDPKTGEDRKDIEFATIRDARLAAENHWGRVLEWRSKDPAGAVEAHPLVAKALSAYKQPFAVGVDTEAVNPEDGDPSLPGIAVEMLSTVQKRMARREFIDARIDAQEQVGIRFPRTITKAQAEEYLPVSKEAPTEELDRQLDAAARRIYDEYGDSIAYDGTPIAERVFRDAVALKFTGATGDKMAAYLDKGQGEITRQMRADALAQIVTKKAFGHTITSDDMNRLAYQDRWISRIEGIPSFTSLSDMSGPVPGIGMTPSRPFAGNEAGYQSQPSPTQSKVLLEQMAKNPAKAAEFRERFDLRFGEGAAMRAINKLMNGEGSE